jgi:protein SCO1/2
MMTPSGGPRTGERATDRGTAGPRAVMLLLATLATASTSAVAVAREAAPTPRATSDVGPGMFQKVKFDQNLDATLPLDVPLRDERGRTITLGDCFRGRPVIVNLVYYECPMLCNEVLNSLLRSLNALSFDVGKEFDVVTLSIDPGETPALATRKKAAYLKRYGRSRVESERGWRFLTGDEASIRRVAGAIGFHYVYDPQTDQFAHPAGIVLATPRGRISRYLFGISYPARDLRLALIEAAAGKIGSPMDQILLMCFHYDPRTGKYNVAVMNVIRLLGCATLAGLGTFLFVMFRRDWQKARPAEV